MHAVRASYVPAREPPRAIFSILPGDLDGFGGLISSVGLPSTIAGTVMAAVVRNGRTVLRRGRAAPVCIVRRQPERPA